MPMQSTVIHATAGATVFYSDENVQGWIDKIDIVTDPTTGDNKSLVFSLEDGTVILTLSDVDSDTEYGYRPRISSLHDGAGASIANAHERHYVSNQRLKIEYDADAGEATVTVRWLSD